MIDASAVASVVGIATTFKDFRGGSILFLPQRLGIFAQGETGVSFDTAKRSFTSAGAVGAVYGYRSPAYLIARELFPANGAGGVGTIPVTFYPLEDDGSGVAAAGDITPSGTPTVAVANRVRIGGVLSSEFVIAAGALTGTALTDACVAIGDAIEEVLGMPVFVTYDYGTVTASALVGTGNGTITALTAPGNARPGVWTLKVNTVVANGGVWTLTAPDGTIVADDITMTPGAGGVTVITEGGLQFTLTDGATDFGLNATFTITVPATAVNVRAGWKGASGNGMLIEILGDTGVTYTITQPTGGLVNPDVSDALALVGNVWETMLLNAMNISDTTTLDLFSEFGEGRWGQLVKKPLMVFTGNTEGDGVTEATAVSSVRRTDRVNVQLPAPGSPNLPFVVAAAELAKIAVMANNNPPTGYCALQVPSIIPGTDEEQWDYSAQDAAIKAGSSTVEVVDSVVQLVDVVTFYRPTGEEPPAYRQVRNIVKLQNIIFNLQLIFAATEWAAAPLVPDAQPVVNPLARKPMQAKAAVGAMLESLAEQAIISDPTTAKKNTTAVINSQNPDRLDVTVPVQLSGNTSIKSVDLQFGFFFGGAQAA